MTTITERMTGLRDYAVAGQSGKLAMKTILAGVAFAIAVAFASQASARQACNQTWHGHYDVCVTYAE